MKWSMSSQAWFLSFLRLIFGNSWLMTVWPPLPMMARRSSTFPSSHDATAPRSGSMIFCRYSSPRLARRPLAVQAPMVRTGSEVSMAASTAAAAAAAPASVPSLMDSTHTSYASL